jgi:hypothetical protein
MSLGDPAIREQPGTQTQRGDVEPESVSRKLLDFRVFCELVINA